VAESFGKMSPFSSPVESGVEAFDKARGQAAAPVAQPAFTQAFQDESDNGVALAPQMPVSNPKHDL
jgi:hypothetical protein